MRYSCLFAVTLSALLTGACAQTISQRQYLADAGEMGEQESARQAGAQSGNAKHKKVRLAGGASLDERIDSVLGSRKDLPVAASDLDPDFLYQFLLAEIAGQRGDLELATTT